MTVATRYRSITDEATSVDFESAVLAGIAPDGGLFVPETLPTVSLDQLGEWRGLSYAELAIEVLSLFIDKTCVPRADLKRLIDASIAEFFSSEVILHRPLNHFPGVIVQELFHGPTLSFKDIAMGFVVNLLDYFLQRRGERRTLLVATSGDTGPAAGYAVKGKQNLDVWLFYGAGFVTEEQERQMTTLMAANVHPVRVRESENGSDDLDHLIAQLVADRPLHKKLQFSSVNSINWARVMMQTVHYFYGYLQFADRVGQPVNFAVPSGGFGNLCGGTLAREMGLPVGHFIVANNRNACLTELFERGLYRETDVVNCPSSAIDISSPNNFWRYLYFSTGCDASKIKTWRDELARCGEVQFDATTMAQYRRGFLSRSIDDRRTRETMAELYRREGYLIDPHGAVAFTALLDVQSDLATDSLSLCQATAHPSKFPRVVADALQVPILECPPAAFHASLEHAKGLCQLIYECAHKDGFASIKQTLLKFYQPRP
ncbi:MAG: threonine synthase [Porticoccaceae bacterium]|nr:threonine synthase [Porticoccaceae bacterium]